jgi:uncharacterized membrane protein
MFVAWETVHIFGVILFMGNLIVTAFWRTRADRAGNLAAVALVQRIAAQGWMLNVVGIALIVIGGYGMAIAGHVPLHGLAWLDASQGCFYVAVIIWLLVLIRAQRRLVVLSDAGLRAGSLDPGFHRIARRWAMWNGIATLLLLAALVLMVTKP